MRINPNGGDQKLLAAIKAARSATVKQLVDATGVTATAVRQRLTRLMDGGFVRRVVLESDRGRPNHGYELVTKSSSQLASNYPDLVLALWSAIKELPDAKTRREIGQSVRDSLSQYYRSQVAGDSTNDRVNSLMNVMSQRGVRMDTSNRNGLTILREHDCPYPELAAVDRGICALEKQIFDRVIGVPVKLTQCQMFGHSHCEFRLRAPTLVGSDMKSPVESLP